MMYFSVYVDLGKLLDANTFLKILINLQKIGNFDYIDTGLDTENRVIDNLQLKDASAWSILIEKPIVMELLPPGELEYQSITLELGWHHISETYRLNYLGYYPENWATIDFWAPQHLFCSPYSDMHLYVDAEINKLEEFLVFFSCVREIIIHTDPLVALGEAEGYSSVEDFSDMRAINRKLFGIPNPGRITFLGREIISILTKEKENQILWQQALDQCLYHESLCSGGELIHVSNEEDISEHVLSLFLEKVRMEQKQAQSL